MKILTTLLDNQQLKPSTPSPSRQVSEGSRGIHASPAVGPGMIAVQLSDPHLKGLTVLTPRMSRILHPRQKWGEKYLQWATLTLCLRSMVCALMYHCYLLIQSPADNSINPTSRSTFMRKKNTKYDLANNGQEAVQKWWSGGFHLILVRSLPVVNFHPVYSPLDGYPDADLGWNSSHERDSTTRKY